MIGVLCKDSERDTAREFFELFKTPWEFFGEGRHYEVVVSTLAETPALNANLLIIYSSDPAEFDTQKKIARESSASHQLTTADGIRLPIYGKLTTFHRTDGPLMQDKFCSDAFVLGFSEPQGEILRVGYDLFQEIAFLLSDGQPIRYAFIPTLEFHISLLRDWIVNAGIPLVEIPPIPWGHKFIVCLTHDVDFGGIRRHKLDYTMWGFVYRALFGSFSEYAKGNIPFAQVMKNWTAVFSLPLVYLGIIKDFWDDFERYLEIETHLASTFFLIPFKNRAGENMEGQFHGRRATAYDIGDLRKQTERLINRGFEIGLHGIDAWNNAEKGKQEMNRIVEMTGQKDIGVRIHWLFFNRRSPAILEQAGFDYDSTFGYNETIGYKAGTTQVFRPLGIDRLLELPLHIQDTALFFPKRLGLSPTQAWNLCKTILKTATRFGGVITLLWHQRSLAPERLWDEFYVRLVQELKSLGVWFGTASQVVQWFRRRRSVTFGDARHNGDSLGLRINYDADVSEPRMFLRLHRPRKTASSQLKAKSSHIDLLYKGESSIEIPLV